MCVNPIQEPTIYTELRNKGQSRGSGQCVCVRQKERLYIQSIRVLRVLLIQEGLFHIIISVWSVLAQADHVHISLSAL